MSSERCCWCVKWVIFIFVIAFIKILFADQNLNITVIHKTSIKLINVLQTYLTIHVDNAGEGEELQSNHWHTFGA